MKKHFLDGFRTKADWGLNRAMLVGALVIFAFLRVGRADWSKRIAEDVPLGWKYLALIALLLVSVCTGRQIYRGILDRALPRMSRVWFVIEALALFAFAITSADEQTLFNLGGLLWVATVFGTQRFYSGKWKRTRRAQNKIGPI